MSHPSNKIPAYIQGRIQGLAPSEAALAAGYAITGLKVTTSRLEAREDVRMGVRKGKRGAKVVIAPPKSKRRNVTEDDDITPAELEPWKLKDKYTEPLDLLMDVMNNPKAPGGLRIQCAKDALPYRHARKESSKKQENDEAAKHAAKKSRYGATNAPSHLRRAA